MRYGRKKVVNCYTFITIKLSVLHIQRLINWTLSIVIIKINYTVSYKRKYSNAVKLCTDQITFFINV